MSHAPHPSSQTPPPWGPPPPQAWRRSPYAHWGKRVAASVLDALLVAPLYMGTLLLLPFALRTTHEGPTAARSVHVDLTFVVALVLLWVAILGLAFWNVVLRQGRTGCTLGKSAVGIRLVGVSTGRPVGAGTTFVRNLAHVLDGLPWYLGYAWPLWDGRRQTFADKVCGTVVVDASVR